MDRLPSVVEEAPSWVVFVKPAGMHTAPLGAGEQDTLTAFACDRYPELRSVPGVKAVEPGLVHRLDRGTSGLVLFARTGAAFAALRAAQEDGAFSPEYAALCLDCREMAAGDWPAWPFIGILAGCGVSVPGATIESGFRAYGPGRVRVAPVPGDSRTARGQAAGAAPGVMPAYATTVLAVRAEGACRYRFRVSLLRGFRHQVRVHLAASGFPIAGDPLYVPPGRDAGAARMCLHAAALVFPDPDTGRTVRIESPEPF